MATEPPNLGASGQTAEPTAQLNVLGADGRAVDAESMEEVDEQVGEGVLRKRERARKFRPRHIQMMALGTFL